MALQLLPLLVSQLQPYTCAGLAVVASVIVCATLCFVVERLGLGTSSRNNLPPGPRPWPIIGSFHLLGSMPHQSLAKLAQKYGSFMSLRLGSSLCVVASTPDMARALLQTHDNVFASRPTTAASVHMLFNCTDLAFAPYGPYWKNIRRLCTNHVFHPKRLELFAPIRLQEIRELIYRLNRFAGQPTVLRPLVKEAANNVISRMTLGKKYAELSSNGCATDVIALIDEIIFLLGVPNLGDFVPSLAWMDLQGWEKRMKSAKRKAQEVMGEIIEQRRDQLHGASPELHDDRPKDLLDALLEAAAPEHKSADVDVQLTSDNITAVLLDMYLAGTDTAAISTEWALAELLSNPTTLKTAQEEIERMVGRERWVEDADVERLPYLQAVVRETFRLHPPAPLLLPRTAMRPCNVAGYELPAGTRAYVNVWAIGRHVGTWEEPLAFRPERFVDSEVNERGLHFELLPFGGGPAALCGIAACFIERTPHTGHAPPSIRLDCG